VAGLSSRSVGVKRRCNGLAGRPRLFDLPHFRPASMRFPEMDVLAYDAHVDPRSAEGPFDAKTAN